MKNFTCLFLLFFLFNSCKKEEKVHKVIYKVTVLAGNPSYSVKYSANDNSTATAGQMTTSMWVSPTVDDRESNTSVFLTLEGGSGGSYKMYIYVDGALEKEDRMDDPYGPKTISVTLPD